MKCPVCKDVTLLMSERKGVEIDYCPECRGIWLDRGELDKLLEKSESYSQKQDVEHFNETTHQEHKKTKPQRREKESFLGEIFDIFGGD